MKRKNQNFLIDFVAFVGFALMTTTGVLMRYMLPPGSGHQSTIWGMDRHEWGDIHFWVSLVFFSVLALHLVLHWRWITSVIAGRPREGSGFRVALGIVSFVAVVVLAVSPLFTPVERNQPDKGPEQNFSRHYEGLSIRGSMTIGEVSEATGVPVAHIIETLKLPESVSVDERFGPLKAQYGFEMDEVREVVNAYKAGR